MIGGVIKYFRFSYDQVLWEIPYGNLAMLLATIPGFDQPDGDVKKGHEKEEHVDGFDAIQDFFK